MENSVLQLRVPCAAVPSETAKDVWRRCSAPSGPGMNTEKDSWKNVKLVKEMDDHNFRVEAVM